MQVLTVIAQEVTRAVNLVSGGIGVASRLNYKIMSSLVGIVGKMIELLLLLMHKVAALIIILRDDLFLFLSDIGSGSISIITLVMRLGEGLLSIGFAIVSSILKACTYIASAFHSFCGTIIDFFNLSIEFLATVSQIVIDFFALIGASTVFLVTFIPKVAYQSILRIASTIYSAMLFIQEISVELLYGIAYCFSFFIDQIKAISLKSVMIVAVGVFVCLLFKYLLSYLRPYLREVSGITINLLEELKRCIVTFYTLACGSIVSIRASFLYTVVPLEEQHSPDDQSIVEEQPFSLTRRPLTRSQRIGISPDITDEDVLRRSNKKVLRSRSTDDLSPNSSRSETSYELRQALEVEKEQQLCVVCQDKRKCVILLPCKHLCLCLQCKSTLLHQRNPCPMCRKPIVDSIRVYN